MVFLGKKQAVVQLFLVMREPVSVVEVYAWCKFRQPTLAPVWTLRAAEDIPDAVAGIYKFWQGAGTA